MLFVISIVLTSCSYTPQPHVQTSQIFPRAHVEQSPIYIMILLCDYYDISMSFKAHT